MPLPDPKSRRVSLDEAAALTRRYRESMAKGWLILRKDLDDVMAQPGCAGVRLYFGRNSAGLDSLVLAGVDGQGNDIVKGVLLDDGYPCPIWCGDGNALNS